MEWARSCYQSQWHLYKDSIGTASTAGRYYFAPANTPHYPFRHNLGSRRWHDANWETVQQLGEDLQCATPYDKGRQPLKLPLPRLVGNQACIEQGAVAADSINKLKLIDGINPACFTRPNDDLLAATSTTDRCSIQRIYAAIIYHLYGNDDVSVRKIIRTWLGDDVEIFYTPSTDTLPSVVVVKTVAVTVVILDGTRNFQTYAWQAFNLILGPFNYGTFGTLQFWYDSATYVNERVIATGIDVSLPITLVGHSYGGAVAQVLATRYRIDNAERLITVFTYGAPKPGDSRMAAILATCASMNIANSDDFTPVAPPDYPTLLPVLEVLGAPSLARWTLWSRPPSVYLQSPNGDIEPDAYPLWGFANLLTFAGRALANLPQSPIAGHPIIEYYQRASLRCPEPQWPVDQDTDNLLNIPVQQINLMPDVPALGPLVFTTQLPYAPAAAPGPVLLGHAKHGQTDPASGAIELFGHQPHVPPIADGLVNLGGPGPAPVTPPFGRLAIIGGIASPPQIAVGNIGLSGAAPWPVLPAFGKLALPGRGDSSAEPGSSRLYLAGSSDGPTAPARGRVVWLGNTVPPLFPARGTIRLTGGGSILPLPAYGKLGLFGAGTKIPTLTRYDFGMTALDVAKLVAKGRIGFDSPGLADGRAQFGEGYSIVNGYLRIDGEVPPPDDGSSCNQAIRQTSNLFTGITNPPTVKLWFRFPLLVGPGLKFQGNKLSGDDATLNIYHGDDCASKTLVYTNPISTAMGITLTGVNTFAYFEFSSGLMDSGDYTLSVQFL